MTLDPARASFVSREFRYSEITDTVVLAKFPSAQEIELNTQLSEASASALAAMIAAEATNAAIQVYTLQIEQYLSPDIFAGGVPRFTLNAPSFGVSRTFKVQAMKSDPYMGRTELVVRG